MTSVLDLPQNHASTGPGQIQWLYTAPSVVEAFFRLQATDALKREVRHFSRADSNIICALEQTRRLILWRGLASPNFELLRFVDLARTIGREPLIIDDVDDRFTPSLNPTKRRLAKLPVVVGRDRSGGHRLRHVTVVNFPQAEGERLSTVKCRNGERLVDFHRRLLATMWPDGQTPPLIDSGNFYGVERPRDYYERLFALMTCFGVQAETYLLEGPERSFTENVVMPAFEAVIDRFGARPLIVELLPGEMAGAAYWESYPGQVLPEALKAAHR